MSTKFQVTIRCHVCDTRYKRVMEALDAETLALLPDPPCPSCKRKARKRRGLDLTTGKAPSVGGSLRVRAVDQTAQIVMQDHGMTDLRSDVREGETMAPKLAPRLQAMADNMFRRPGRKQGPSGTIFDLPPQAVVRAAVTGRFKTRDTVDTIAAHHRKRDSAPVRIIAGDGVRSQG